MSENAPVLEIRGMREVRIGRTVSYMQNVHVGRVFVTGGRLYQLTVARIQFSRVPVGARFRRDDIWHKRTGPSESRILDPNMPLADPGGISVNIGHLTQVSILELALRGTDDETAPPALQSAAQ